MKKDIILSGVGGQGILSIANLIGIAALKNSLFLKQSEVHGMSQRGGAVQSHLRISDKEIASDLIPKGEVDLIISVEPMESLRYLPWLRPEGWLITNTKPFINIDNYPEWDSIISELVKIKNHILIDADKIANEIGSGRSSNIVILGAAMKFIDLPFEYVLAGINKVFESKGKEIIELNICALTEGKKAGEDYQKR
jgi:indolepyruvate ferredoxin oxidoreductase, beta subunit